MNIYDFDKTIYKNDSTTDFYFFCLKKYPQIIKWLPYQAFAFFLYIIGVYTKTRFKECFYRFFASIPDIESDVISFWDKNQDKIKSWYKSNHRDNDIVISASPHFLLKPICDRLNISTLIASKVDPKSGKYDGENCWGEEKVNRLKSELGTVRAEKFYSDSLSDTPLATLARESYIVSGDTLTAWSEYKQGAVKSLIKMIFSREFLSFGFIGVINTVDSVLFSYLYSLAADANLSFAAGYVSSLIISYFLNTYITFKDKPGFVKFLKFASSYIPNFIIQNVILFVIYNLLGMDKLIAYILAGIIGIPVTFVMMKLFVFGKKSARK